MPPAVAYAPSDEAAVVYQFHIALRGVSPKVWRRVELTAGSSLADLERVIQISLGAPPRTLCRRRTLNELYDYLESDRDLIPDYGDRRRRRSDFILDCRIDR